MPTASATPPDPPQTGFHRLPESVAAELTSAETPAEITASSLKNKIVFPCPTCGADLAFDAKTQQLKCGYCAGTKQIHQVANLEIKENDFLDMLEKVKLWRIDKSKEVNSNLQEIMCPDCGAKVVFEGTLTSDSCPYCATPLQIAEAHAAEKRVPTDGVLPLKISREDSLLLLKNWTSSLWFAPYDFKHLKGVDNFQATYLPFWTYDAETDTYYEGQRGENYTVTIGTGKNRRTVTRTHWYPASGRFDRFFNDILITGSRSELDRLLIRLNHWPLKDLVPFQEDYLAGYTARTYDLEIDEGFKTAKTMMDEALYSESRQRIGGDRQQVDNVKSKFSDVTYKLILLPIWILVYKYNDRKYQVIINGTNGQIAGDRPYIFWKILGLTFIILSIIAGIIALVNQS